jgi:predicted ABC-type ATPase
VRPGGHAVPEQTVRRRYERGLRNLFGLYMPLADTWQLFDNSDPAGPILIAAGERSRATIVDNATLWVEVKDTFNG